MEYTTATLSCPEGNIVIRYAGYGVLNVKKDKCTDRLYLNGLMEQKCNGKKTCSQDVNNGALGGDPCRGLKKALEYEYDCR